jgi:hypothetical protein
MKRLALLVCILLAWGSLAGGQGIDLDTPETLQPLTSQRAIWRSIEIFPAQKKMIVHYAWLTVLDEVISLYGIGDQQFVCRDIETPGTNAECLLTGNPYPCCTGLGTGNCDGLDDDCFSSIFEFPIPSGAVGQPFGRGFRLLIKNQWRDRILTPGNDGTFE